jgi:hypothetical protein
MGAVVRDQVSPLPACFIHAEGRSPGLYVSTLSWGVAQFPLSVLKRMDVTRRPERGSCHEPGRFPREAPHLVLPQPP